MDKFAALFRIVGAASFRRQRDALRRETGVSRSLGTMQYVRESPWPMRLEGLLFREAAAEDIVVLQSFRNMAELVRTSDPASLSAIDGVLTAGKIPHHVADRHASNLDGLIEAIKQRVLVPDEREAEARALLIDADLGEWLRH